MMKRRDVLTGIAAASLLATAGKRAWADGNADDETMVDYLFVQNAQQVTLEAGVLTLKGVAKDTLYFSDRPERIVGRETTQQFVDQWGTGDDSFAKNPPNAVLSITYGSELQDIVVVLRKPSLEAGALIYDVEVLEGKKTATGEAAALFIDVIGRPLTPLSVAGVARRSARRSVRRRR